MTREERGAASLLVVSCVALVLLIGCAMGVVTAMVRAHRAAQSAADLAALAGASALQRGQQACLAVGSTAALNGASVDACTVDDADVRVRVTVPGPHWLGQTADLTAEARAGPS